jgi:hypothetical protein
LNIRYGRLVITPAANPGVRLRVIVGDHSGTLTLTNADTIVAIEVRRFHSPGANPESEQARYSVEFFVTSGQASWEEKAGKSLDIPSKTRMMLETSAAAPPAKFPMLESPKWISAEVIKDIDRRASQAMLQAFTMDQPALPKLLEMAEPTQMKQIEVRRLAIRCLGYLGYFDQLVTGLNDPAFYKTECTDCMEQLCEAAARDSRTAKAIRLTLEKRYKPQAANLYRMVWGYSNAELIAGDDEILVKNLRDELLAVRVLSFWNLKEITGKKLSYEPEGSPSKRSLPTQTWEQRLKAKEIRIKSAEELLPNTPEESPATLTPETPEPLEAAPNSEETGVELGK